MAFGRTTTLLPRLLGLTLMSLTVSGCLDSQFDQINARTEQLTLSGSVGDGPVVTANMRVLGADASVLTSFVSDTNAQYQVTVDVADYHYPLTIDATGGTDLVTMRPPDFRLESVAFSGDSIGVVNLNPFSTLIVAVAENLPGGLNVSNVAAAEQSVITELNSGLDVFASSGVVQTPVVDANIAEIVKASETLGELVRRTSGRLNDAGFPTTADEVINTVASDLSDGLIDGLGASGADPRLSAVATLTYAQVLMEAMANDLHVLGISAEGAMNSAIQQVGNSPVTMVGDMEVTADMIRKARIGLAAAYEVTGDPAIRDLHADVSGLDAGMAPTIVRFLLPSNYRSVMSALLANIAAADTATIDTVNRIARGDGNLAPLDSPPTNASPVISGSPPRSVEVGQPYSFTPGASDPDGDTLTFTVANLPSWADFDNATGTISGTPGDGDAGDYPGIRITVSDGALGDTLGPFTITVTTTATPPPTNEPPVISGSPPRSVEVGQSYSFTPEASDPDGDALTFSVANLPSWAAFDDATGTISGTPGDSDAGQHTGITVTVSDGSLGDTLGPFTITVTDTPPPANEPPVISGSPPRSVEVGQSYSFTPAANDADGDTLTFNVANLPSWATFDNATGTISGTPGDGDVGDYRGISITVSDGSLGDTLGPFTITVTSAATPPPANEPPVISGSPPRSVEVGQPYSFTPTASDPDGDTLTYSVANLPSWATFGNATGTISGTPGDDDAGDYTGIRITVSDGLLGDTLGPFTITVTTTATPPPANEPPVISGSPPRSVEVGQSYSFTPSASDPDGDTLTFSVANLPSWAAFDSATGAINGTPGDGDAGDYPGIRITVSDGSLGDTLGPFTITVNEPPPENEAPVISGSPPRSVDVGQSYSFTPTANDPDGDTLTFSVANLPSWAAFNNATGTISGTPGDGDAGDYSGIRITVSDGSLDDTLGPFTITVSEPPPENEPPVISGSPPRSVEVGQSYSFTPTASDPDGDALTFSVANLPSWASFDDATGTISGTPGDGDVGDYTGIRLSVSDGTDSASIVFQIRVEAISLGSITLSWTPPTLNSDGSPLTDLAGYRFYWGTTPGNYTESEAVDNPGLSTYVIENLEPGTYEFAVTAVNSEGTESTFSEPATGTVR